jgi:hypothetical protein
MVLKQTLASSNARLNRLPHKLLFSRFDFKIDYPISPFRCRYWNSAGSKPLLLNSYQSDNKVGTRQWISTNRQTLNIYDDWALYTVTYRGFYSRWKSISVPKSQHTTVKYTQPFSKHTSGVYTQRCPTHDSFYMTSSDNLPTRTHILAVSKSPHTGARPASTFFGHKLSFLQSGSFQTHVLLSQFPNSNSSLPANRSP